MTHRAHIALRTAPGPRVRHRYLKAHSQCRCYALAKGATGAFCSFCGGGDFEKLRETHVVAELERSTKPVALAWDRRANAATATAAGRRADARRRRKREKEWSGCMPTKFDHRMGGPGRVPGPLPTLKELSASGYLSKINTNEDAHAIAVSQFKMRRLRPGQPAIADELRRFPPAVTPSMLAILQDVAVRTHKERLANRIQWHKSPPKLSSAQQAAQAAAKRRQLGDQARKQCLYSKHIKRDVGKLKALTAADVTKRKQEQFERQRDEKAASWAAKYEEERRQEAKLRHETRLVQKILGDMPT